MKKFFTTLVLVQSMLWISTHSVSAQNSIAINSDADRAPSDKNSSANITPQGIESMWDILVNYDLLVATSANGNAGVCFFNNEFWVSRWGYMGDDTIIRIDASGNLIDKFRITGVTGIRSFTTDGTYIYAGINTNSIKKIDPTTKTLVSSITAPAIANVRSLTYDPTTNSGAGGFWVSSWATDITQIGMNGTATGNIVSASNHGLTTMYGTAYDGTSVGGPYLWVFDQGAGTSSDIYQISIATETQTGVIHDANSDVGATSPGIAGGIFFYKSTSVPFVGAALIGVIQGTPSNSLFAYSLDTLLGAGIYENNNPGNFIQVYPNPVKDRVNIHLDKQNNGDVHLQIMDVQGKIVFDKNTRGLNNYINLSGVHSGLYFVKASYDGKIYTTKLVKE